MGEQLMLTTFLITMLIMIAFMAAMFFARNGRNGARGGCSGTSGHCSCESGSGTCRTGQGGNA